ncbi:hypothetical protein B0T25DRAFT_567168 [Lasiosphaeria hispida]|uniref:Uncharacterized protein n=1 Tax=Lasiosphaeria hispida TaxID=260671 RepID=A0AAJ0MGL0_9PEZI|nr:hypothetical protein B0T25DRAFT_567168 [Lasiosphaeria hispida]
MQYAVSTTALHAARNEANPYPNCSPRRYARANALFIYQILRLLTKMPVFYELTGQSLDILPLYPISAAREFWGSWVFQESARRTLATILFFLLAYQYVKGKVRTKCNQNSYVCRSVTLSAHLWQADDPVDFALAWRNKRHFVMHSEALESVTAVMEKARSDDVGEFGQIFLTGLTGRDEAKGWLALRVSHYDLMFRRTS